MTRHDLHNPSRATFQKQTKGAKQLIQTQKRQGEGLKDLPRSSLLLISHLEELCRENYLGAHEMQKRYN